MQTINIAQDYTPYPGGRYPKDGKGNGTDFRSKFLLPVLRRKGKAQIILDGAAGYPSSFLEEAFAGLVRLEGFSKEEVLEAFEFIATQPGFGQFSEMIKRYVADAKPERKENA